MNENIDFVFLGNRPRIVPFSATSTAYGRLKNLPPQLLKPLHQMVSKKDSHLPEWLTPSKIELIQKDQAEPNHPEIDNLPNMKNHQIISNIYMSRKTDSGIEFLIQFKDDGSPFCSWINEKEIFDNPSFPHQLEFFQKNPFDFKLLQETEHSSITVITHRIFQTHKIYLFNVSTMAFNVYFWENTVKNEIENDAVRNYEYYFHRFSVENTETMPEIPSFTSDSLQPHQISGIEWLLSHYKNNEQCILGDEKSLGSMNLFIEFLSYLSEYVTGPFLLVLHSNQIPKWKDELNQHKKLYCLVYDGDEKSCEVMREYGFHSVSDDGISQDNYFSFNVLIVSYEILKRDFQHLCHFYFRLVCIDNPASSDLDLLSFDKMYKVVIYDNLIESSTKTIVKIITYLRPELHLNESLFTKVYKQRAKQLFESIILCRTCRSISSLDCSTKEYIGFIMPTSIQRMMLRLIDLHQLHRICQPEDRYLFDFTSNDILSQKVCDHPYLIDGAESFLTLKIGGEKRNRLVGVSSKFVVLDRILPITLRKNVKVVIFTKSNSFLRLIEEFCNISNWPYLVVNDQLDSVEKTQKIDQFNTDPNCRILLSQINLNFSEISAAALIFIFDSCWNPIDNDISKKSEKLVIRLITFGTIENDSYIELRKQRDLWESILITQSSEKTNSGLICPPDFSALSDQPSSDDFVSEINRIMQLVPSDSIFENATIENSMSDNEFLEYVDNSLPCIKKNSDINKTLSRHDFFLLIDNLKKFGYGEFKDIADHLHWLNETQLFQYCAVIVIFSFQSICGFDVPLFPVLISKLNMTVPDFSVDLLFANCQKRIFPEISNQVSKYRSEISLEAFNILNILEIRCLYKIWSGHFGSDYFVFSRLPPIHNHDYDWGLFNALISNNDINVNERIEDIVMQIKYDLLIENVFESNQVFDWWCRGEFEAVLRVFKNFGFDLIYSKEFHSRTGLFSKSLKDIKKFALGLKTSICTGNNLYPTVHQMNLAPEFVQKLPSFSEWSNLKEEDILQVKFADDLMSSIKFLLSHFDKIQFDLPLNWTNKRFKKLLLLLAQFGIGLYENILNDSSYGFPPREMDSVFSDIDSFFFFVSQVRETYENCK